MDITQITAVIGAGASLLCTLVVGALTYFMKRTLASLEDADKRNAEALKEEAQERERAIREEARKREEAVKEEVRERERVFEKLTKALEKCRWICHGTMCCGRTSSALLITWRTRSEQWTEKSIRF